MDQIIVKKERSHAITSSGVIRRNTSVFRALIARSLPTRIIWVCHHGCCMLRTTPHLAEKRKPHIF